MPCLRSQRPSPTHPPSDTYITSGAGWPVVYVWGMEFPNSPQSLPFLMPRSPLRGRKKKYTLIISPVRPSHLQNDGPQASERWQGLMCIHGRGGERRKPL